MTCLDLLQWLPVYDNRIHLPVVLQWLLSYIKVQRSHIWKSLQIMSQNDTTARIAHVFKGTFVHSTPRDAVEILENSVLGVDDEGKVCLFNFHSQIVSFHLIFIRRYMAVLMYVYTYISNYFFINCFVFSLNRLHLLKKMNSWSVFQKYGSLKLQT